MISYYIVHTYYIKTRSGWQRAEVVWSWEDRTFFSSSPFCQLVMKINGPRRITAAAAAACSGDGNTMLTFLFRGAGMYRDNGDWSPPTFKLSLVNPISTRGDHDHIYVLVPTKFFDSPAALYMHFCLNFMFYCTQEIHQKPFHERPK